MEKTKKLRKEKLTERDSLSDIQLEEKSSIIQTKIFELDEIKKAESFFIYVSFRSEVKTLSVIDVLLSQKKEIAVPITHFDKKRMDAVQIIDRQKDLSPGYCGIPEPKPTRAASCIFPPDRIDIVMVPGSVFDERGGRFGYGGGYYDRFLANIPNALRIGLAFDFQVVERLPLQPHDQILDLVVTEERTIKTQR